MAGSLKLGGAPLHAVTWAAMLAFLEAQRKDLKGPLWERLLVCSTAEFFIKRFSLLASCNCRSERSRAVVAHLQHRKPPALALTLEASEWSNASGLWDFAMGHICSAFQQEKMAGRKRFLTFLGTEAQLTLRSCRASLCTVYMALDMEPCLPVSCLAWMQAAGNP